MSRYITNSLATIAILAAISCAQAQSLIFSEPENVLSISSNRWETMPHLSSDGLRMYFSFDSPISQLGEIYMASRGSLDEPFGESQRLGGTSGKVIFLGSLAEDELAIYYSSFAPPFGLATVHVATRTDRNEPFDFDQAKSLGELNDVLGRSVQLGHVSNDGNTIYFNADDGSAPHPYVAKRNSTDVPFENATPLRGVGHLIEYVTDDQLMMFSWSVGDSDLFMSSRPSLDEGFGPWANLGPVVNSPESDETFPFFHESTSTLYFSSDRPGSTVPQKGRAPAIRDIWQSKVSVPGDFDFDHAFTGADIDMLSEAIQTSQYHFNIDSNRDGHVDLVDHSHWVHNELLANTHFGDSNLDGEFNANDILSVLQAAKYGTGEPATWSQGDWNADGAFDAHDIVVALQDGGYDYKRLAAATPAPARWGEGDWDRLGSLSFGNVAQTGLFEESVRGDLSIVGSLAGGGDLGNADLVYVPEPASVLLLSVGFAIGLVHFRRANR